MPVCLTIRYPGLPIEVDRCVLRFVPSLHSGACPVLTHYQVTPPKFPKRLLCSVVVLISFHLRFLCMTRRANRSSVCR